MSQGTIVNVKKPEPRFAPGIWERFFTICLKEIDRIETEAARNNQAQDDSPKTT